TGQDTRHQLPGPRSKPPTTLNMAASFASRVAARHTATSIRQTHMRWRTCTLVHLLLSSIFIVSFPSTRTTTSSHAFLLSPLPSGGAPPSWLRGQQRSRRPGRLRAVGRFSDVNVVGNSRSETGSNGCNGGDGGNNGHCGNSSG
ncbi:unnamed protein product, partial [Laminaria digitata]